MRVICPYCHQKAIITSSSELSEQVKDLYCQCGNTKTCGASFVFTLAFKYALNPPQQTTLQIAASLVASLNHGERQQLQREMLG